MVLNSDKNMEKLIKEFRELKKETLKLDAQNDLVKCYNNGAAEMLDYVIGRLETEKKK